MIIYQEYTAEYYLKSKGNQIAVITRLKEFQDKLFIWKMLMSPQGICTHKLF